MKLQILAITMSPELANLLKPEEAAVAYSKTPQGLQVDLVSKTSARFFVEGGILLGDLWAAGYFPEE